MKLKSVLKGSALLLSFLLSFHIKAQRTAVFNEQLRYYNRALELFEKEKYAAAQKHFLMYTEISRDRETAINAAYYAGVCAMELFNADAINLLNHVRLKYPEHSKAQCANYQLGKYFYRNKDNKTAIKHFETTDPLALTPDDADEYWFMKGYCYFKTERFDESKTAFQPIKDKQGKFYDASNYYYGYVVYRQGNYDEALLHFTRAQKSRTFGPLAQVYIAQIYFARKQYNEVVQFADTISNKEIIFDVAGIVGQSYYHLGNFNRALPYLEKFNSNPPVSKTNQDIYRLGYTYFQNNQFEKAIEQLVEVASGKDTTAQYANMHLAACYLKTDQKQKARNTFDIAYRIGFNKELTELALYNFAKLSYELGNQQDALRDLVKYVNNYPEAASIDEAKTLLSNLLLNTRNYKEAIQIIESIKNPSKDNQTALQRVCYYRAEELYLNNDYTGALELFTKSSKNDSDKKLFALAHFWIGELNYKLGNYQQSFDAYLKFSGFNEIKDTRFFALSSYNKGYCRLKQEQFDFAITEFETFVKTDYAKANPEIFTDASMRIADCFFVLRNYDKAIAAYDIVIQNKLNGSDYALYQKAMILGVQNKSKEKIASLQSIIDGFKRSPYIDDALFEIANVNLQTENYADAVNGFQNIIDNYPRSSYIRKALLNKGLAQYNQNKDEDALDAFKQLITQFSTSPEAREALVVIKNIFVNKGQSEEYLEFVKVLPNVVISPTYQDSVTFESAFNLYKNGDCSKSSRGFANYINRFQGGFFILKANYYKAECDFKLKNYDSAIICYEYVATYNRNDFTERATRQAAVLHLMKKNYDKSFEYYASLERIASSRDNMAIALLGQLKCASSMQKTDTAAQVAMRYLNSTITQKEGTIEARYILAKYYMQKMQPDSALSHAQFVVKETKNAWAAECKYYQAQVMSYRKDYKNARKQIFELSDNYSSYEFWVAKGFILLADVYLAEKDAFQAKATLQSLMDNYDGEDIKIIAREKLQQIITEEEKNKPAPKPEIEKEIQNN
jgi:TolA-binding protein